MKNGEFIYYSPKLMTVPSLLANIPSSTTHLHYYPDIPINLPLSLSSLSHLTFYIPGNFDESIIHCVEFPPHLTQLKCFKDTNCEFWVLPPKLTHLSLSLSFLCESPPLLSSLTHLTISGNFIPEFIPPNITHLTFSECYKPIYLPPFLTYLKIFHCEEVKEISSFPPTLTHFIIDQPGILFSLSSLPLSLLVLDIQCISMISHEFPNFPSLKYLRFPNYFDLLTSNILIPDSLETLKFGKGRSPKMPSSFPSRLKKLILYNTKDIIPKFPPSLKSLTTNIPLTSFEYIPPITHLTIENLEKSSFFPSSITHLKINLNQQTTEIPELPPSLIYLFCLSEPGHSLPSLPHSLKYLITNLKLPSSLPPFLTHLSLESSEIIPPLPISLTHFCFKTHLNAFQSPAPSLPPNLIYLSLPVSAASFFPSDSEGNNNNNNFEILGKLLYFECSKKWFANWKMKARIPKFCFVQQRGHTILSNWKLIA